MVDTVANPSEDMVVTTVATAMISPSKRELDTVLTSIPASVDSVDSVESMVDMMVDMEAEASAESPVLVEFPRLVATVSPTAPARADMALSSEVDPSVVNSAPTPRTTRVAVATVVVTVVETSTTSKSADQATVVLKALASSEDLVFSMVLAASLRVVMALSMVSGEHIDDV